VAAVALLLWPLSGAPPGRSAARLTKDHSLLTSLFCYETGAVLTGSFDLGSFVLKRVSLLCSARSDMAKKDTSE
jgi:hypothetical protein